LAHGSGPRLSPAPEARAIRRVFGATAPPVTACKWAFGHPLAASGILDSVLALVALRHGVVPGVATLRELDPDLGNLPVSPGPARTRGAVALVPAVPTLRELDPDLGNLPVSAGPQAPRSDVALVLNRGFGGSNTALLFRA